MGEDQLLYAGQVIQVVMGGLADGFFKCLRGIGAFQVQKSP